MHVGYGQNAEDTQDEIPEFRIGIQASLGDRHMRGNDAWSKGALFSYSFGLLGSYRPSGVSRWSFNAGIQGMSPFVDDNTRIFCDMGYCPHDLQKDNYLSLPLSVDFAPVKCAKKGYRLSLGFGIAPYLLLWGKRSEYRLRNGEAELYVWRRYSLFNAPSGSGMGLFAMNYVVAVKNEFSVGNHRLILGIQSQFWLYEQRLIQDNMSLYFGFLF